MSNNHYINHVLPTFSGQQARQNITCMTSLPLPARARGPGYKSMRARAVSYRRFADAKCPSQCRKFISKIIEMAQLNSNPEQM